MCAYDTRYDPETDWTLNQVLAFTGHMLRGSTAYGTATDPTLVQVEDFIDGRVSTLALQLEGLGYAGSQPVATVGTAVTTILSRLVAYGVVADIEATRPTSGQQAGEENTRFQFFDKKWVDGKEMLNGAALEHLGATRDRDLSSALQHTGQSWDEQDDLAEDEDNKISLFPRGFMDPDRQPYTENEEEPDVGT